MYPVEVEEGAVCDGDCREEEEGRPEDLGPAGGAGRGAPVRAEDVERREGCGEGDGAAEGGVEEDDAAEVAAQEDGGAGRGAGGVGGPAGAREGGYGEEVGEVEEDGGGFQGADERHLGEGDGLEVDERRGRGGGCWEGAVGAVVGAAEGVGARGH